MAGVFQNIDPPPPTARRVCTPRLWCGGRTHSLGGEGDGGSIFWKTSDTALYSTYVSTLWLTLYSFSGRGEAHTPATNHRHATQAEAADAALFADSWDAEPARWRCGGRRRCGVRPPGAAALLHTLAAAATRTPGGGRPHTRQLGAVAAAAAPSPPASPSPPARERPTTAVSSSASPATTTAGTAAAPPAYNARACSAIVAYFHQRQRFITTGCRWERRPQWPPAGRHT
jgi:hypothetical protein